MSEISEFCIKVCPLGIEKCEEFINKNNSVFEAASDMHFFVEECIKTCPHKDAFNEEVR